MTNIIAKANKKLSIGMAAALISGSYFLSAILGLLRDRLLAARFGIDSGILDAYWAAFSIPDMMYFFLVTGALSVTFIPVFIDRLQKGNRKSAWEVASSTLNLMAGATLIGSVLIFIFADPLISLIAPGFSDPRHDLAVSLMRVLAINPFVFSISTVLGAMQQASGRFLFYAIAPLTYNLGIIGGIVFLAPTMGILGVALGVALGSLLQLAINLVGMIGIGYEYTPIINWKNKGFRQVVKLLIPRSVDQGIDQLNSMVERIIASFLGIGAIASYQYAFNLHNQPIVLIGVAIATAAFPSISARASSTRSDLFRKEVLDTLGTILWLAVPAAVIAFIMRGYLVRLYLGQGDAEIANALGWFTLAIIGRAVFHAISRAYYAQQDTKTPLRVSVAAIGLNILLAFMFVDPFGVFGPLAIFKGSISGLAFAQSIVAVFESVLLFAILHIRYKKFITVRFSLAIVKIMFAALVMAIVTYFFTSQVFPLRITDVGFFTLIPRFLAVLTASGFMYLAMSYILGLKETGIILNYIREKLFKPLKISL